MNIQDIQAVLETEKFVTSFYEAEEEVPIDRIMLMIELEDRPPQDAQILELLFVPEMEEELEGLHLLQFFVTFQFETENLSPEIKADLKDLIITFNTNLPVGAFGYNMEHEYLYFKSMLMLPDELEDSHKKSIIQTVWLIVFQINLYFYAFEKIVNGEKTFNQLLQEARAEQNF